MSTRFVLILGGARSGKSNLAQEMAQALGERVLFVATAAALDDEMKLRIEEHKRKRSESWRTLEASTDVGKRTTAALGDADVVVVDCVTLLVSNVLLAGRDDWDTGVGELDCAEAEAEVLAEIEGLLACVRDSKAAFIVVSNEVGLGLVPVHKSGRVYRDSLGKANQLLARQADEVYLMVAGLPWQLKGSAQEG
jgi:adenosylcobinamide kinase/adenosylcobinamide-phosphate guanylyltransferase